MRARTIDPFTAEILSRSALAGNMVTLPEQLPREDYVKVDKVLRGLGGKWDRRAGGHVFPFPAAELVGEAAASGTYVDRKQDLQFFETPTDLAERMAELAYEAWPGDKPLAVLEPSAGTGQLVKPLLAKGAIVMAIEIDPHNAALLRELRTENREISVYNQRFEEILGPRGRFDAVVMNPPFTRGQDAEHVMLAWEHLKEGGRLVAICSSGAWFRSDKRSRRFCEWLAENAITVEILPRDTFRQSGTSVETRLLTGIKRQKDGPLPAMF